MKNSILKFLYFMDNDTGLYNLVQKTEKYKSLNEEAFNYYRILEEKLDKKDFTLFDKFVDAYMSAESEFGEESFITGFKCGLRLAVECVCDDGF